MQITDFTQSYFHFEVDLNVRPAITVTASQPWTMNQVRIPLECRCEVTDPASGATTSYVLAASCKTEKVGVERDVWTLPNADFCVVYSGEAFLLIKRWHRSDVQVERESVNMATHVERQVCRCDDAWTAHRVDVVHAEARLLETVDDIIDATLKNRTITSRTTFELADGRQFVIEYPVKTINISTRDQHYQVDTGPVLWPDPSIGHETFVGNYRLAYIAHNCAKWAELLVNVPTPVTDSVNVHHFSRPVRLVAKNMMFEIIQPPA